MEKEKKKQRKQGRKTRQGINSAIKYPLLCFDTETTNHGELLELSVFDIHGNEVYHQYFRPKAKHWPTDIHHITPEMVAECNRFRVHRSEVWKILNSTRYLVGCALSNDLHTLRRHGVEFQEGKHKIIDVQNWFWLLNDASERQEKHQVGLAAIADAYGLGFGEEQPHSATADTRLTLDCYKTMAADFKNKYPELEIPVPQVFDSNNDDKTTLKELDLLQGQYEKTYNTAMHTYRMKNQAGFINVVPREQGYTLKYSRFEPTDKENILFSIPVNDRVQAEIDLRRRFEPIQVKGFTGFYNFTEEDFDYIRNYRNTITLETYLARVRTNAAHKKAVTMLPKEKGAGTAKPSKQAKTKVASKTRLATQAMRIAKRALKKE